MSTRVKWAIRLLKGLTLFRAQTILFLPKVVVMFGGPAPDAWFMPWLSESMFGFLVPVLMFLILES